LLSPYTNQFIANYKLLKFSIFGLSRQEKEKALEKSLGRNQGASTIILLLSYSDLIRKDLKSISKVISQASPL
jgi:hypothetical protein